MDQMVDVGGHRLHIRCTGRGEPTVVIDTGVGDLALRWHGIQDRLAEASRVCTYDRAGYGKWHAFLACLKRTGAHASRQPAIRR
jgi:hypothetical protein